MLDPMPVDTSHVQVDGEHDTGQVTVAVAVDGQPEYTIHEPSAWDFLELTDDWVQIGAAGGCDLLWLAGATRCGVAADDSDASGGDFIAMCSRLRCESAGAVLLCGDDCRSPLELATVVKMNDAEVPLVLGLLGTAC